MKRLVVPLLLLVPLVVSTLSAAAAAQSASILDTKHNLSTSGPGPYKATQESRICIFCHTPHRGRTTAPLWNREDSRETYLPYASSTFEGTMDQPTGGSKLCLSCHDGSIALGAVVSMNTSIEMAAGFELLQSGPGFIGTSLMDDHPISFDYATSQGGTGVEFVDAGSILAPVHLDPDGMVQCTSCHEAHDNSLGHFLLTTDRYSSLCLACHVPDGWMSASHDISTAIWDGVPPDPWPTAKYSSVAENACANCHQTHGAAHAARLLASVTEEDGCLPCHNGHVAQMNVEADLSKLSRHNPYATLEVHDPAEDPLSMPRHAECADCHDPHAARAGTAVPPDVPGPITGASGMDSSGQVVPSIYAGYQLCFKCHAENNGGTVYVSRQHFQINTRLEFDLANPSYHPVEGPGVSADVPSLLPPWSTASVITCTDCHQSENSPAAGGIGPAGPHGSVYRPLLVANYDLTDNIPESPQAYALCYKCHSRTSILSDESFKKHRKHVVKEMTSCSVCHDAHGVSHAQGSFTANTHLINFDISVVDVSPGTGLLEFRDEGVRRGSCALLCHGEDHQWKSY